MKATRLGKTRNKSENGIMLTLKKDWKHNYSLYIMMLPVLAFYFLFSYKPMYGLLMAFQRYDVTRGIWGSDWVGLRNFERFFMDPYFMRNITNTLKISLSSLVFAFPAPIIFALLMNEINNRWFKKTVQTITYLPHFISLVVICSLITIFVDSDGIITQILGRAESLLYDAAAFVPIYIISDIWQGIGWGSIMYLAALTSIDEQLYEAAGLDGAGRFKQVIHVTLPGILPTIIIMFILRTGNILNVGYEKIMLLTNQFNAESSEILSYYIYKKGFISMDYGLSTAAGLFNSTINLLFVCVSNYLSGKYGETSMW